MADEKKKKPDSEYDIFILNSIFPNAEAVFSAGHQTIEELVSDSVIVLDTNALLVPYSIGKDSLEQISNTYREIAQDDRLRVPGQVAREFARNRASRLGEIHQQFNRKISSIPALQKGKYPLLESSPEYQKVLELEAEIDKMVKSYRDAVHDVLLHIRNWSWNDPVSVMYSSLFSGSTVFDIQIDKDKISAELARRQTHNIPPGYKDAGKEDAGIGDLLIWLTIIEIGKQKQKSVLFVTGDEKADWQYRSEGRALYPRFELVDEFRRNSGGQTFHIVSFSQLLDLYGASKSTVQEVRREEQKVSNELGLVGLFIQHWQEFEKLLLELSSGVIEKKELNKMPPFRVAEALIKAGKLSDNYYETIRELAYFRNKLIHQEVNTQVDELKSRIATLEELIIDIKLDNF